MEKYKLGTQEFKKAEGMMTDSEKEQSKIREEGYYLGKKEGRHEEIILKEKQRRMDRLYTESFDFLEKFFRGESNIFLRTLSTPPTNEKSHSVSKALRGLDDKFELVSYTSANQAEKVENTLTKEETVDLLTSELIEIERGFIDLTNEVLEVERGELVIQSYDPSQMLWGLKEDARHIISLIRDILNDPSDPLPIKDADKFFE